MRRTIGELIADPADGVFECADGAEAFALNEKYQPDQVLMDIEMNDTDVYRRDRAKHRRASECAKRRRALSNTSSRKI